MPGLADKIRLLTPEQQRLVEELVEMLLRSARPLQPPRLEWVGKAREIAPHLDSVQLQHEINRWRGEPSS